MRLPGGLQAQGVNSSPQQIGISTISFNYSYGTHICPFQDQYMFFPFRRTIYRCNHQFILRAAGKHCADFWQYLLFMKGHLSLLCIVAMAYTVSAGFVYQGVRELPFAPDKVESVNGNLLLINPLVIRKMQPGANFYSMQFGYTPPYYLTNSYIAYQQQEKSPLIIKDINLLPQITYVNEQTNYVLERGLFVDGEDVIVPLSGGKMAIGLLSSEGKLNIQTIQGGDYFEYGSIAKIHEKQLAIGCKEHLYIIDRQTYKVTQSILLEQMMLEYYDVEFSQQGKTEIISIGNSNVYWVYERSSRYNQFTLIERVHYNAWMNTVFQYSQHTTYILTPSCEVLQQDLTKGDNFLSFNSEQYFFDRTIAVSPQSTYFLSNTGYLQVLDPANTLISVHSRLPGFQELKTVTSAEFTASGRELLILSSRVIQRYVISSKKFDPITIKQVDAFAFSVDSKLVFTISKTGSILVFTVYDGSNFEKVVSLNFQVDQLMIVDVSIYKVYDQIQDTVHPLIFVCTTDKGEFRAYSISYSEETKTITRQGSSKLPKDYQILSSLKATSFVCLINTSLELRNWKGDRLSTRLLSRSPSFIKAGQNKVMITYQDGVSDFYAVNTEFVYIGSHYRYKDGADYSTMFLEKLGLVYTYYGGSVFYKTGNAQLPIRAKTQLQNNLCSVGMGKAIISKTAYGAERDFFVAFLNYNNSQIIYAQVVPNPKDSLHFIMTKTVNVTKNVTLDRDSVLAYNRAKDILYMTARIKNQSKTLLMGAGFSQIGDSYKWRWSYSLKRVEDFDFDLEGNLVILGETVYGNIYKFAASQRIFNKIKLTDILAANRAGDRIFIKKQAPANNDGVAAVGAVFNVKEAREQYTFQLPGMLSLFAINIDGDLVIVSTDGSKSLNLYQKGKVQSAVIFQTELLSLGFQSNSEFFVQTDSSIMFFEAAGVPIQIARKFVRSKSAKLLYACNDTNFVLQQNEKLVILDANGKEAQQLSLPKIKKGAIQNLMIASDQQILASRNSSLYSWREAECPATRQNKDGVCQCILNSVASSGSCECIRGYHFNSGNCEQCAAFCDTCDENGCVSWNIALFASLAAGVMVVLAMAWYGVRRFIASSPKIAKESLLSEPAQGSTIIEQ